MFLGSEVRRVRRADNLTTSVSRLSRQCGILNISQPYRPPRHVTGIALLYFIYYGIVRSRTQTMEFSFFIHSFGCNLFNLFQI
jgi:hypothetical protein